MTVETTRWESVREEAQPSRGAEPERSVLSGARVLPEQAVGPVLPEQAAGERVAGPGTRPSVRPGVAQPAPTRPVARPGPTRPGGRRGGPELPPVRPRVGGGSPVPAGVLPVSSVVYRRRRVAAVVLAGMFVALVVVAVALLSEVTHSGGAWSGGAWSGGAVTGGPVPTATTVTVVGAGETLIDVAHRAAPEADTDATVERIRELNTLPSSAVSTGRPLVVPTG